MVCLLKARGDIVISFGSNTQEPKSISDLNFVLEGVPYDKYGPPFNENFIFGMITGRKFIYCCHL